MQQLSAWFLSISQKLGHESGFRQRCGLQLIQYCCVRHESGCILRDVNAHASQEQGDDNYHVDAHSHHVNARDVHDDCGRDGRESSHVRAPHVSPP